MIIGIGSDIVKISRIEALLVSHKQRFLHRIFTSNELSLLNNKRLSSYVAKRFAAKEAFSKALGTGIGKSLSFKDIEIFTKTSGEPYFEISSRVKNKYNAIKAHLSMTDEAEYAQAFVIIEER